MISISKYREVVDKNGNIKIYAEETLPCPICGESLSCFAWRLRIVIGEDGNTKWLLIRRLRCSECGKIHHELPIGLVIPYKRHCAETIQKIIKGNTNSVPCCFKVAGKILAWWEGVNPYFTFVLGSLTEKLGMKFSAPPAIEETVRAVVNSNNWIFAHSVPHHE